MIDPSVWAGLAGLLLLAQSPEPVPEPPGTVDSVTVTAPRGDPIPSFVGKLAAPNAHGRFVGQIPRWNTPVCPGVLGASPKVSAYFVQRISATARAAGAPLGKRGCRPNLIVAVTNEGDHLAEALARNHRYRLFGQGRHQELGQFRTEGRPVRWWHLSRPGPARRARGTDASIGNEVGWGGGAGPGLSAPAFKDEGTRLRENTQEDMTGVLVVVDAEQAKGVPAQALSAYVAMIGLARLPQKPGVDDADTILNIFAARDGGRSAPADLTAYDRAYLRGLYSFRTDVTYPRQWAALERRMRRELEAAVGE